MLIVRIWLSSKSSIAATSTPALTVAATVLAASYVLVLVDKGRRGGTLIVGKETTATEVSAGMTANLTQISVTMPNVPSDPMNNFVKSYPAEDFLISTTSNCEGLGTSVVVSF